jgi:hypothetical protein
MKTFVSASALVLAASFLIVCGESAKAATVVSNPAVTGIILSLGERPSGVFVANQYYAQSFTTPVTDTKIEKIRFYIYNSTDSPSFGVATNAPLPLRLLLTTVTVAADGIRPNQVLFEQAFSVPYVNPAVFPVPPTELSLPDISLIPGTEYAFILDAAADINLTDSAYPRAAVVLGEGYNGGRFFQYRIPFETNGGVVGTRASHFSSDWIEYAESQNVDMAFDITFVPEPSAFALLAIGAIGFGIRRRIA